MERWCDSNKFCFVNIIYLVHSGGSVALEYYRINYNRDNEMEREGEKVFFILFFKFGIIFSFYLFIYFEDIKQEYRIDCRRRQTPYYLNVVLANNTNGRWSRYILYYLPALGGKIFQINSKTTWNNASKYIRKKYIKSCFIYIKCKVVPFFFYNDDSKTIFPSLLHVYLKCYNILQDMGW